MWYRLVADTAMVAHVLFLAYLVVGGFVAWRWPLTIWTHVAAGLYGLFNVLIGWPCPLTQLENWGRTRAGEAALPATGFIDHYIAGVVYPQEHEVVVQALAAAVVLASWIGFVIRRRQSSGTARTIVNTATASSTRRLSVDARPGKLRRSRA